MLNYPYRLFTDLLNLRRQAVLHGWATAIRDVLRPDASPSWQFTKYLVIGGLSVLVFYSSYGLFRLIVELLIPGSFTEQRMLWNLIGILVAFIPTNSFTYKTNRRWVFLSGKYDQKREFILFTSGAAVTFVVCQLLACALIKYSLMNDTFILLIVIFASTMTNYIFRKLVVFNTVG